MFLSDHKSRNPKPKDGTEKPRTKKIQINGPLRCHNQGQSPNWVRSQNQFKITIPLLRVGGERDASELFLWGRIACVQRVVLTERLENAFLLQICVDVLAFEVWQIAALRRFHK